MNSLSHPWYFVTVGSATSGPFTNAELIEKFHQGAITPETLVWNQSLPSWQKFSKSKIAVSMEPPKPVLRKVPPKLKVNPPPLWKNYNQPNKVHSKIKTVFWVLLGALTIGFLGLSYEFLINKEWKTLISQSWAIGLAAGNQAALDALQKGKLSGPSQFADRSTGGAVTEQSVDTQAAPIQSSISPASSLGGTSPPTQEVTSSNPIVYAGSFINQTTGESGDLSLHIEHLLETTPDRVTFGGKLLLNNYSSSVTGNYDRNSMQISFSPGVQSQVVWNANNDGKSLRGTYTHKTYSGLEHGIWESKLSGGPSLQEAASMITSNGISSSDDSSQNYPKPDGQYNGFSKSDNSGNLHNLHLTITSFASPSGYPLQAQLKGTIRDVNNTTVLEGQGAITYGALKPSLTLRFNDLLLEGAYDSTGMFKGTWSALKGSQSLHGSFEFKK